MDAGRMDSMADRDRRQLLRRDGPRRELACPRRRQPITSLKSFLSGQRTERCIRRGRWTTDIGRTELRETRFRQESHQQDGLRRVLASLRRNPPTTNWKCSLYGHPTKLSTQHGRLIMDTGPMGILDFPFQPELHQQDGRLLERV